MYQQSFNFYKPGTKGYFKECANQIIERNRPRIEKLKTDIKNKKQSLESRLHQFNLIEKVWDAARFAEKYNPDSNWHPSYSPKIKGNAKDVRKDLKQEYPKTKKDINETNAKQAKWVCFQIQDFKEKTKRKIKECDID